MQHHAPHKGVKFEGHYDKFDLVSGAHIIIVISKVHNAQRNANALTFTYIPKDGKPIYQKLYFVDELSMQRTNNKNHAFTHAIPSVGSVQWSADGSATYDLATPEFSFHAKSQGPGTAWPATRNRTPEGFFVNLPLPLHWHVQSLSSPADVEVKTTSFDIAIEDISTTAKVHHEKNWATSFPKAHMWVQARKTSSSSVSSKEGEQDAANQGETIFNCSGGEILGMQAFLIAYVSPDLEFAFRPPFALRSPFFGGPMSYSVDWKNRAFKLSVRSLRRRIEVKATAPKDTFYPLASPFEEGHRENFLGQSQKARVELNIYESGWFSPFKLVREEVFENAGLEFGGAYYPPAGTDQSFK